MTDKATDVTVTQADEKRADDWAMMLGRMGGVILDQSQRRGLAAQFAAHRIESTRTVPSGDDKHPEIGPGLPPLSSGEGRTAGEDRLREAAQELLDGLTSTYRARNGREVGIEADDGEKCYIVHSELVAGLRASLAQPKGDDHG